MDPHTETPPAAGERIPPLTDEESFREAIEVLLTAANQHGLSISDQSWKCISTATGTTWDVEITTVETS